MKKNPLLLIRRAAAAVVFCLFFLALACGLLPFPWLAHYQIGPALLTGGFVFLGIIALLTIFFGRIYCAALCPLGIMQDLTGRAFNKSCKKPLPAYPLLRIAILTLFGIALASASLFLYGMLDPYSAFGRICSSVFAPLMQAVNNLLAVAAEELGLSVFKIQEIRFAGWPVFITAVITLIIITILVWKLGRVWCNFCPVGTALGFLGRKSLFRMQLDKEKCIACRRCERTCKTGCIDINQTAVDASRCVACQKCAAVCPANAINYRNAIMEQKSHNEERRALMRAILPLAAVATLFSPEAKAASGQEINRPDVTPQRHEPATRETPVTPPGSRGADHFSAHCIGCQLCVEACPNNALKTTANGTGPLQPQLVYDLGYCRPNCVKCGEVCPAGAIEKLAPAQKPKIKIGSAQIDFQRCIVNTDEVPCTACQRICPSEAISLEAVPGKSDNLKRPVADNEKCTGCGACEYICAARPLTAITVNGLKRHGIL